jgi:hypothetical protein
MAMPSGAGLVKISLRLRSLVRRHDRPSMIVREQRHQAIHERMTHRTIGCLPRQVAISKSDHVRQHRILETSDVCVHVWVNGSA